MKKILLTLCFAIVANITTMMAQNYNIQTGGMARVDNQKTISYYENDNYSFTFIPDYDQVIITRNTGNGFSRTGTYKVEYATTVYDNVLGKAYAFSLSRNSNYYTMTVTSKMVSFNKMNDQSTIWHFYITKGLGF